MESAPPPTGVAGPAQVRARASGRTWWRWRPSARQTQSERPSRRAVAGHPAGLYLVCAVESCFGFASYVLGSLLVLYLTGAAGQDASTALRWVGTFNAVGLMAPLVGGLLADRWLGFRRAVLGGAALLTAGFALLAVAPMRPGAGLLFLLGGSGLFRSNIVAMLGRLYSPGHALRERGYRLLYAAFNLGALLAPPVAGALAEQKRWSAAFLLGAVAMLLGLVLFQLGYAKLARVEHSHLLDSQPERSAVRPTRSWARWLTIGVLLQVAMLWTVGYGQADGTLLLWARDHTRRALFGWALPASAFSSIPPLLVLLLTPLWGALDRANSAASSLVKILGGLAVTSLGFLLMVGAARQGAPLTSALWLLGCLGLLTAGELLVGPLTQSLITQLAPPRLVGLTCAVWYGATAVGFWIAGQIGELWQRCAPADYFGLLALIPIAAGLLLLAQRYCLRIELPE